MRAALLGTFGLWLSDAAYAGGTVQSVHTVNCTQLTGDAGHRLLWAILGPVQINRSANFAQGNLEEWTMDRLTINKQVWVKRSTGPVPSYLWAKLEGIGRGREGPRQPSLIRCWTLVHSCLPLNTWPSGIITAYHGCNTYWYCWSSQLIPL